MTEYQNQPGRFGKVISEVIQWCIAAGGGYLMLTGVWAIVIAWSAAGWPTTRGTITEYRTQNPSSDESARSQVSYIYHVGGQQYTGSSVYPGDSETSSPRFQIIQNSVRAKNLLVHYRPSDPSTAYLEVGVHRYMFLRIVMGSLLGSFGAVFILVSRLSRKYGAPDASGEYSFPLDHPVSRVCLASFALIAAQFGLLFLCAR